MKLKPFYDINIAKIQTNDTILDAAIKHEQQKGIFINKTVKNHPYNHLKEKYFYQTYLQIASQLTRIAIK